MTIDQTRQMAVEFERRVNTIDPTTESTAKLDTDTIFSYLNQYQSQYIHQLYLAENQVESGTRGQIRFSDITKNLIKHIQLENKISDINTDMVSDYFKLPNDFYMYIRSNSVVLGTYKDYKEPTYVANSIIKQDDVDQVLLSYYNKDGIMRNPIVVLDNISGEIGSNHIQVIHDKYTNIKSIDIVYYKEPARFNIMYNLACELPYECFDDIVSGAVELYFSYKYKVSLAQQAARYRRPRQQEDTSES